MSNNAKTTGEPKTADRMEITKSNVESLIAKAADALETPKDSCPTSHYNAILGLCMAKLLSHDPEKTSAEAVAIWEAFPKSPSAMRQHLWDAKKEKAKASNELVAKLNNL